MDFRTLEALSIFLIFCLEFILLCSCVPPYDDFRDSSKISKAKEKDSSNEDYARFTAPQLSKADKRYLTKIEDALTSKKGRIIYTNSWAVQLKPEEVASADQIAKRNGFHNVGQVIICLFH